MTLLSGIILRPVRAEGDVYPERKSNEKNKDYLYIRPFHG